MEPTRRVIALGFFDGVHIGHGALLRRSRALAGRLGCTAAALTFDAAPAQIVGGTSVPLLNTTEERIFLMRRLYGLDEVLTVPFDRKMMQMPWRDFIETLLIGQLHAVHVVCGHDFRFGYRAEGTPQKLAAVCAEHGVGCDCIEKVEQDGMTVSSTWIRVLIQNGDIAKARRFLGHPPLICGTVLNGNRFGRTMDFATANLSLGEGRLLPPFGVYAAKAELSDGRSFPALVNVGVHPTVGALSAPILEAHLLGFDCNLYGQSLRVWLYENVREERHFSSVEALKTQIAQDRQAVISFFEHEK